LAHSTGALLFFLSRRDEGELPEPTNTLVVLALYSESQAQREGMTRVKVDLVAQVYSTARGPNSKGLNFQPCKRLVLVVQVMIAFDRDGPVIAPGVARPSHPSSKRTPDS
jgi:hypothetical protein